MAAREVTLHKRRLRPLCSWLPGPLPDDFWHSLAPLRFGQADPTRRIEARCFSWAFWCDDGPATIRIQPKSSGLLIEAWGAGARNALRQIPVALGLNDGRRKITERFSKYGLQVGHPRAEMPLSQQLIPFVLCQNRHFRGPAWSWFKLTVAHGRSAPGPCDLLLPCSNEKWSQLSPSQLKSAGIGRCESLALNVIGAREKVIDSWRDESTVELQNRLRTLPGIEVVTVAAFLAHWTEQLAVPRKMSPKEHLRNLRIETPNKQERVSHRLTTSCPAYAATIPTSRLMNLSYRSKPSSLFKRVE